MVGFPVLRNCLFYKIKIGPKPARVFRAENAACKNYLSLL